ncbi:aminotransferase [Fodinicurvata sp. EGI_FJ10296]|uniref:aminotransferase n=1 Tax=Fodinicurvata sp. EGI_FJ10296 TaxID=3231908 RepID=UPI003454A416
MPMQFNPSFESVEAPPIAAAQGWIRGLPIDPNRPLIDLAQAVPADPPPVSLTDHLSALLTRPETHLYTDILGLPALRDALAVHMSSVYEAAIPAERVAITAGCNQAFCLTMQCLASAGDEVLLPEPHYFNHKMWLDALGLKTVTLPFRPDRAGIPDPIEAERLITPRTRAIVLVTPNNPTGAVYPAPLLDAFAAVARRAGIALVLDETYKDFHPGRFADNSAARTGRAGGTGIPHALFQDSDWGDTVVQLYSFSKAYSMTGYRVGSVIAGPRLIAVLEKAMDCMAICAPRIGQEAALFALASLGEWSTEKARLLARRADRFRSAVTSRAPAWDLVSIGAFFAYLRHPFDGTAAATIAEGLARQQRLLVLPGTMFGAGQQPYLRIAFANVADEMAPTVADRLQEYADTGDPGSGA